MNKYVFDIAIKERKFPITIFAKNFESASRSAIQIMKQKHAVFAISYIKTIFYDKTRGDYVETV